MSDDQPRAEWVFPEEKKSNKGRIWLVVGLSVLAIAIVGALLYFFIPRGDDATPAPSPTTSTTKTPTPIPTATPTPTPTATPTPAPTTGPVTTPPPIPDPDVAAFAAQVRPRLDDASTGLSIAAGTSGQDAAQIIESLQQDAANLSGAAAPSSIADSWYAGVSSYGARLDELRSAYQNGAEVQDATNAVTSALQDLRALVGL